MSTVICRSPSSLPRALQQRHATFYPVANLKYYQLTRRNWEAVQRSHRLPLGKVIYPAWRRRAWRTEAREMKQAENEEEESTFESFEDPPRPFRVFLVLCTLLLVFLFLINEAKQKEETRKKEAHLVAHLPNHDCYSQGCLMKLTRWCLEQPRKVAQEIYTQSPRMLWRDGRRRCIEDRYAILVINWLHELPLTTF